jgi:hypothetical protein
LFVIPAGNLLLSLLFVILSGARSAESKDPDTIDVTTTICSFLPVLSSLFVIPVGNPLLSPQSPS